MRSLVGSLLSQALTTDWLMVLWEKYVVLLPPERRRGKEGKEGSSNLVYMFSEFAET